MKKSFAVWLETLKKHVETIENHDQHDKKMMRFVFENAMAHLVLGWAMLGDDIVLKLHSSSMFGKFGKFGEVNQDRANKDAAKRVAEFEKVVPWWSEKDRLSKFQVYLAKILNMSTSSPSMTILAKLYDELDVDLKVRRSTKKLTNPESLGLIVAGLIGSDLGNVSIDKPYVGRNLSILLRDVEKVLRDRGFIPGTLYVDAKPPKRVGSKKSSTKK